MPYVHSSSAATDETSAGLEWGSGDEHLVLLHSNGFCAGLFRPLARRLATDHHVVAVDLAGHGRSSALPHDDLTFTRLASDVIAVLDGLGVASAVAAGQSLGKVSPSSSTECPGLFAGCCCAKRSNSPSPAPAEPDERAHPDPAPRLARPGHLHPHRRQQTGAGRPGARRPARLCPLGPARPGRRSRTARPRLETEAAIFEVSATPDGAPAAWAPLASRPAVLIAGDRSFLPLAMLEQQAAHGGGRPLEVLPGSHFLLQEDTSQAANLLRTHLQADDTTAGPRIS